MTILHVAVTGSDHAQGTASAPLRTIQAAAEAARPGDTVRVHEGTYREWVRPVRGGLSDARRIVFEAAPGEHVAIKGSEVVTGWEPEDGTVWRTEIDNALFGTDNPFAQRVTGDWIVPPADGHLASRGDVYLDGRSCYEARTRGEVSAPVRRTCVRYHWTGTDVPLTDPDGTVLVWYAEVGTRTTTVWVNFHGARPDEHTVEVNVRPSVFSPERLHVDYVTVRGFEIAQAATPWAPPTGDQLGIVGPRWAKGWIIEDNVIHDAKCAAVSLGKEGSTGDNYGHERGDKPGYQYQLESVFTARRYGWSRDTIGSHVVRRNEIHSCGQNGVVGHLGAVFSTIEDNHIHHIGTKHEFYGYEIGAIKLHAPIDVRIVHNRIHDSTIGIWLDWQVQGTRVSRNLLYRNVRDVFVEVSHGPAVLDHNVLASPVALELFSQGNALLNNLVLGAVRVQAVLDRATPYHVRQSTDVAGYALVHSGDDRYVGNLFLGAPGGAYHPTEAAGILPGHPLETYGTHAYDGSPASWEEYLARVGAADGAGDHARFHHVRQPAYVWANAYAAGARAFAGERDPVTTTAPATAVVLDHGDTVTLVLHMPDEIAGARVPVVTGRDLGRVRLVDAEFETPHGTLVAADVDLVGTTKNHRARYPAGPLAHLPANGVGTTVWTAPTRPDPT